MITIFDIVGNLRPKSGIESVFSLEKVFWNSSFSKSTFSQSDSVDGPLSLVNGGRTWLYLRWDGINCQKALGFDLISPIMLLTLRVFNRA